MANRVRGEAEITVCGEKATVRLHMGALAELEEEFGVDNYGEALDKLQSGLSATAMVKFLRAILRANGHEALSARAHEVSPAEGTSAFLAVISAASDPDAPKGGASDARPRRRRGANGSRSELATSSSPPTPSGE